MWPWELRSHPGYILLLGGFTSWPLNLESVSFGCKFSHCLWCGTPKCAVVLGLTQWQVCTGVPSITQDQRTLPPYTACGCGSVLGEGVGCQTGFVFSAPVIGPEDIGRRLVVVWP